MTAAEFRTAHGDPETWSVADMEAFEHLAETEGVVLPAPIPADHQPTA